MTKEEKEQRVLALMSEIHSLTESMEGAFFGVLFHGPEDNRHLHRTCYASVEDVTSMLVHYGASSENIQLAIKLAALELAPFTP